MHLYAPSTAARETLTQEARVIVAKSSAPQGTYRQVQLLIPESPEALFGIDTDLNKLGVNRTYKLAAFPPGGPILVKLLPHQTLVGASKIGLAHVTVLVEHVVG